MSHFSVAVFTDEDTDVESLLRRFNENIDDLDPEYIEFVDETENLKKEFESKEITDCIKKNGKWYIRFDEEVADCIQKDGTVSSEYEVAAKRVNEIYKSVEEYAEQWYNYKWNEEFQAYGYYHNPNAKWDWYVEGGRFSDRLYSKSEEGFVDSAEMSDLDLEKMREDCIKEADSYYDKLLESKIEQEVPPKYIEEFFKKYPTKEKFVNREAKSFLKTYAVITPDGEWHAPGDMWWWGLSTETAEEEEKWDLEYEDRFIKPAIENDWTLTIIDCHI